MKKSDLKSGMLVENKEGNRGIVLIGTPKGDVIAGTQDNPHCKFERTWAPLSSFNEDLKYKEVEYDDFNIQKIYGYSSNMDACSLEDRGRELLWERAQDITIKLTDDYDAKIDLNSKVVKVGCQTVPFDKIEEIHLIINSK